jgi:hypothetical protein
MSEAKRAAPSWLAMMRGVSPRFVVMLTFFSIHNRLIKIAADLPLVFTQLAAVFSWA